MKLICVNSPVEQVQYVNDLEVAFVKTFEASFCLCNTLEAIASCNSYDTADLCSSLKEEVWGPLLIQIALKCISAGFLLQADERGKSRSRRKQA